MVNEDNFLFFEDQDKRIIKGLYNDHITAMFLSYLLVWNTDLTETEDGWWFSKHGSKFLYKEVVDELCFTRAQFRHCIKKLVELDIMSVIPLEPGEYYIKHINSENLNKIVRGEHPILNKKEEIDVTPKIVVPELIEYWNTLKHVTKHKKPNSLIWKDVRKYTKELKNGEFVHKYNLDAKGTLKQKKWDLGTLKQALDKLSLMYDPTYEPKNKKWLKGLSKLIYDPFSKRSQLLECWVSSPKPLQIKNVDQSVNYEYLKECLFNLFVSKDVSFDPKFVHKACNEIEVFHKKVLDKVISKEYDFYSVFKNEKSLTKHYIDFLHSITSGKKKLTSFLLGTSSSTWDQFMEYICIIVYGDKSRMKLLTEL